MHIKYKRSGSFTAVPFWFSEFLNHGFYSMWIWNFEHSGFLWVGDSLTPSSVRVAPTGSLNPNDRLAGLGQHSQTWHQTSAKLNLFGRFDWTNTIEAATSTRKPEARSEYTCVYPECGFYERVPVPDDLVMRLAPVLPCIQMGSHAVLMVLSVQVAGVDASRLAVEFRNSDLIMALIYSLPGEGKAIIFVVRFTILWFRHDFYQRQRPLDSPGLIDRLRCSC